jgi:hypothetical protein
MDKQYLYGQLELIDALIITANRDITAIVSRLNEEGPTEYIAQGERVRRAISDAWYMLDAMKQQVEEMM